jgi:hypothetical protein
METNYQKFKIDDHLKRYEKALRNLSNAGESCSLKATFLWGSHANGSGPDRFDEAMAYVEKHRLYNLALSIWEGTENYKVLSGPLRRFWIFIDHRGNLVRPERLWRAPVRKKRVLAGSYG